MLQIWSKEFTLNLHFWPRLQVTFPARLCFLQSLLPYHLILQEWLERSRIYSCIISIGITTAPPPAEKLTSSVFNIPLSHSSDWESWKSLPSTSALSLKENVLFGQKEGRPCTGSGAQRSIGNGVYRPSGRSSSSLVRPPPSIPGIHSYQRKLTAKSKK